MAKGYYSYRDENVNWVNSVTTVDGVLVLTDKAFNKLKEGLDKVVDSFYWATQPVEEKLTSYKGEERGFESISTGNFYSNAAYRTSAYSKCCEDDNYDAKTGMIIASRKAEIKAEKRALKDLEALESDLKSLLDQVYEMRSSLSVKVHKDMDRLDLICNETTVKGDA